MTTRGQAFVAAGITLALSGLYLGVTDLVRVGALLVLLPVITRLFARSRGAGLTVERTCHPNRLTVDEPGLVTLDIANTSKGPTALHLVEEHLDYGLGDRPRFVLDGMWSGERRRVEYAVRSHHRGRHTLGPMTLTSRDVFGLTAYTLDQPTVTELLVLPRVVPLGDRRPPGLGLGQEGETPHLVTLNGEDDASVREYREGDSLRRIHWPSTARMGELMVRQEDRPARRRVVVLLDHRAEAFGGVGPTSSYEWAVIAAASIVAHCDALGYAVHLLCAGPSAALSSAEATTTGPALETLALTTPHPGRTLDELVAGASPVVAEGGLLVAILGDLPDDSGGRLAALRASGATAMAFVLAASDSTVAARQVSDDLVAAGWASIPVERGADVRLRWTHLVSAASGSRSPSGVGR